jgi:uncharacterized protein (DUF1778 family)
MTIKPKVIRKVVVNMRMSEEEASVVYRLAKMNGESISSLLRRLALSEARKVEVQK